MDKNVCLTRCQTEEGLFFHEQENVIGPWIDMKFRSVNRKVLDKLQKRIKSLEALNKTGSDRPDWRTGENDLVETADPSAIQGDSRYVLSR
jgi:hypothetical protein